jgi:hypothetical protein
MIARRAEASASNRGTPEMSRMTTRARALLTACRRRSVRTSARRLSKMPTRGTTRMPSTTGAIGVEVWRMRSSNSVFSAKAALSSPSWVSRRSTSRRAARCWDCSSRWLTKRMA